MKILLLSFSVIAMLGSCATGTCVKSEYRQVYYKECSRYRNGKCANYYSKSKMQLMCTKWIYEKTNK